MINSALTICKRILSLPDLRDMLIRLEEEFPAAPPMQQTPLGGVSKLQEIINRGQNHAKIFWLLSKTYDDMLSGARDAAAFSVRCLKGGHAHSITDIYLVKRRLKIYLLTTVLDSKSISPESKAVLREVFDSVQSYCEKLRPITEDPHKGDATFLHYFSRSAMKFLSLVENIVYLSNPTDEAAIRTGLKAGRQAEEMMSYSPFSEWMADIDKQLELEQKEAAKFTQPASPDAQKDDHTDAGATKKEEKKGGGSRYGLMGITSLGGVARLRQYPRADYQPKCQVDGRTRVRT